MECQPSSGLRAQCVSGAGATPSPTVGPEALADAGDPGRVIMNNRGETAWPEWAARRLEDGGVGLGGLGRGRADGRPPSPHLTRTPGSPMVILCVSVHSNLILCRFSKKQRTASKMRCFSKCPAILQIFIKHSV